MSRRITQKMVGPAGKTNERAKFMELIRQGMSSSEACRVLGVNRKTGSRWRNGRVAMQPDGTVRHYAPVVDVIVPTISPRFLSEDERVRIADLHRAGMSLRMIATNLNRSPSTISREVRRNASANNIYRPFHAHKLARIRRARTRHSKIACNPALRDEIRALLMKRWSPALIAQHLRTVHPEDASRRVVHESIYRDLYDYRGGALKKEFCRMLRTKRDRRKPSRLIPSRRTRFATALSISDRPFDPSDRSTPGHWEGDLIMGQHNRSAIATLVERTTRFTLLLPIDAATRSESLSEQLIPVLEQLPPSLRRSITWDQGSEMARHAEITAATGTTVYICDAHSPWQRGTNENTNRLQRDYFPKRTNLNLHSPERIAEVAAELNARPRQVLHWNTPEALFATLREQANNH